jgi:hypothetical protein
LNFFAAILYSLCPVLLLTLILTFILLWTLSEHAALHHGSLLANSFLCLRGGATAHVRGSGGTDSDAKLTGGWRSDAHDVYKRANFAPSDRCAASMRDNSDLTLISYVHTVPKP